MQNERGHDDDALNNYKMLKNQLEQALKKVNLTSDLREAKGILIEVQSGFKGLKLAKEDREELYGKLQDSFTEINKKIEDERTGFNNEAQQNYRVIKTKVDEALFLASNPKDFKETWDFLIEVQTLFKGTKLLREHRENLYARLQEAFEKIKAFKEIGKTSFEKESSQNYVQLIQIIEEAISMANQTSDFRIAKDALIMAQAEFRNTKLTKEQRDELNAKLQDAFTTINLRQDHEKHAFESDAQNNYIRLKAMVNDGLVQAEESNEYKETREYLKKIQSEFKGIKLIREEREELYSRLQSAFEILNKRVDGFFHEKKKNWEVKMQYKLSSLSTDIFELEESLENDVENLKEMEDHLRIIQSSGKKTSAVISLKARISSTRISIGKKENQIRNMELEMADLKKRMTTEE